MPPFFEIGGHLNSERKSVKTGCGRAAVIGYEHLYCHSDTCREKAGVRFDAESQKTLLFIVTRHGDADAPRDQGCVSACFSTFKQPFAHPESGYRQRFFCARDSRRKPGSARGPITQGRGVGMRAAAVAGTAVLAMCAGNAVSQPAADLPDMIVSATGQEASRLETGFSATVITAADIASRGWVTLPEALRTVPGLHIAQHGAPGSTVSIVMRGARTGQVLVLLNGVRLNDPSSPTREAEIADIDLANVERIEVLRGPQSGLYGADAAAGVINIITRTGTTEPEITLSVEGGSYQTWRTGGRISGTAGKLTAAASATYARSDGFSSANSRFPGNTEDDGFKNLTVDTRLRAAISDAIGLDAFLRYQDSESEYDDGAGPFADAPDSIATTERIMTGAGGDITGGDAYAWRSRLQTQYSAIGRTFEDSWGSTTFDSTQWQADWRQDITLHERHRLSGGLSYHYESAEGSSLDSVSADTVGLFLQNHMTWGPFSAVAGIRHDEHEQFGGETTWRAAPTLAIDATGTRLLASVGTGFKAPSLYQLYGPETSWGPIGNTDLEPETSLGWEAGFEQQLAGDRITFGTTWFQSTVDDQIEFVVGYQNVSKVKVRGVESFVRLSPFEQLDINASYTYTKAEEDGTDTQLLRVPKDRATLDIHYRPISSVSLSTTVLHVGSRNDRYFDSTMFTSVDARAESYTVVNLAASVAVRDNLTVFARLDNLFDESYEEVYGFGTAGRSAYTGLSVRL